VPDKLGNSTTLAQSRISHKFSQEREAKYISVRCMVMGSGSVNANDSVEKADIALLIM
jgi:hypothetical protein